MLEKRKEPNAKRAKEDLDAFSAKVANEYFKIVREEVKRFAPNHMYLGCRFHGHIENSLMAIAMEYVDVVTYNIYQNPPNRSWQYKELKDKTYNIRKSMIQGGILSPKLFNIFYNTLLDKL